MFSGRILAVAVILGALMMGCTCGPKVPANAMLVFHGPMTHMSPPMPKAPGTLYIVEAGSGKVVGAMYFPGESDFDAMKDGETKFSSITGLRGGRTYTWYYVPSVISPEQ